MNTCFLCGRNGHADPLDRHHIFGGARRKQSEKLGLVVRLCHSRCHEHGKDAVHESQDVMDRLHQLGQQMAMAKMDWTREDFIKNFGKNYLPEGAECAADFAGCMGEDDFVECEPMPPMDWVC